MHWQAYKSGKVKCTCYMLIHNTSTQKQLSMGDFIHQSHCYIHTTDIGSHY